MQVTTNAYNGYGNLVRVVETRANANSRRATESVFDLRNRKVQETRDAGSDNYTFEGDPASNLDYENARTTFVYDAAGNLTLTTQLAESATPGSFNVMRRTSRKYDALDRLVRETVADENDPTTTADDADDLVDSINERATVNDYDAAGNLVRVQHNPLGNSIQSATAYAYDALGRQIETTDSGYVNTGVESTLR